MAQRGRKPKTTEEQWYDLFADADVAEQEIMLQILGGIHRQARRGRLASVPAPTQLLITDEPEDAGGPKQ